MIKLKSFLKKIYWSINFSYTFKLNEKIIKGLKIYHAKSSNDNEKWMGQILAVLFKNNNNAFLDIGVNIGQTLCQVKSLDWNRKYYGFEPNPSCNMFVEELIRINKFPNVKVFPVGIYTQDSILELDLYYDDITNSGASIIKNYWSYSGKKPHRTLLVPLMTYDTVVKTVPISKIGILKIDVEGAELDVFESLFNKINSDRPYIIIEVLSAYSNENHLRIQRQEKILELIKSLRYRIFRINENKKSEIDKITEIEIFDPSYDFNQTNYLLIPSEILNSEPILQNIFSLETI